VKLSNVSVSPRVSSTSSSSSCASPSATPVTEAQSESSPAYSFSEVSTSVPGMIAVAAIRPRASSGVMKPGPVTPATRPASSARTLGPPGNGARWHSLLLVHMISESAAKITRSLPAMNTAFGGCCARMTFGPSATVYSAV
jgi:hypothetical protein